MKYSNYHRLLNVYESWESLSKNINDLKDYLKNISKKERNIFNNIIIFKKIKKLISDNPENKIKILVPVYSKYKEKTLHRFYIFNILQLKTDTIKILNKELFKMKPIEEQQKIRENISKKIREKYNSLSMEEKKILNKKRIEKKIKKMGLNNYKLYCLNMYKKWYKNLSKEKKEKYSLKRKNRYENLPDDIKQKYKKNKQNKILSLTEQERKALWKKNLKKRNQKIEQLNPDDKKNYYEKLKLRKKIYFDNITIEKRKVLNKIRTYKRQLNKNYITLEEFNKKKEDIIRENYDKM
jgi:hypothetical protein